MFLILDINNSFFGGISILDFCHFYKDQRLAKEFKDVEAARIQKQEIEKLVTPGYCFIYDKEKQSIVE